MSTTTLSIDKSIHKRASKRAKKDHVSVSAAARILLDAYAKGDIQIMAFQFNKSVELYEHDPSELSTETKNAANRAYKRKRDEFVNL